MARYRTKDEADLAWNRIRSTITMLVNLKVKHVREEILNKALSEAFSQFVKAQGEGEVAEVEARYANLVSPIVEEYVPELEKAVANEQPDLD